MNLGVAIGKLNLKNPVMAASGTFGYGREFEELVDLKNLGAIVTKTITLKPRTGNPMPRTCETAAGMLNSIGLKNEGIKDFIKEKVPCLSKLGTSIIVSISGDDTSEFCELVKELDGVDCVKALELNISCPNIKTHLEARNSSACLVAQDKDATYEVVSSVRKITKKTLITKLSPNVTSVVEIAQAACKGGSDAVSLVNTLYGMAIDINTKKPKLGNIIGGLSGPAIKPIALRMVWEVSKNIEKPVIGIGGIMTSADAIEFMLAGATAVQVGTANFVDPKASEKIIKGIEEYLKEHKIDDVKKIIGAAK